MNRELLEMLVLGHHRDLLSQKLWVWGPVSYGFTSPPGDLMWLMFESYSIREVGRDWIEAT